MAAAKLLSSKLLAVHACDHRCSDAVLALAVGAADGGPVVGLEPPEWGRRSEGGASERACEGSCTAFEPGAWKRLREEGWLVY